MDPFRFWLALLALWGIELAIRSLFPLGSMLDPLLIFLLFLGLRLPSGRFLWGYGALLGFLKDLATGGLFGGFTLTFVGIGWLLGAGRHWVEREDPLLQGIWVGLFTGLGIVLYGLLVNGMEPGIGWNRWGWIHVPLAMGMNGFVATWVFPHLKQILKGSDPLRRV